MRTRKQAVKRNFQIVVSVSPRSDAERPVRLGVLGRLKMLLGGFLLAAFTMGTLVAALVVGSAIALVLGVAVVIVLVAVIARVAFWQATRKRAHEVSGAPNCDVDN